MTESAEEKRKRRLIDSLENYQWKYQYSIFPRLKGSDKGEDLTIAMDALLEHDRNFRRKLGEQFPDTAILFEFRRKLIDKKFKTNYKGGIVQVYITFHTSRKLDKIKLAKLVDSVYVDDANLLSRKVIEKKMEEAINKIKKEKLHSQIKRSDGKRVNRFSIIHEKNLVPVSVV